MLFLARVVAGIASSIGVSLASAADISESNNKTKNYGYIFSMMGLGFIIGPVISTISIPFGQRIPFYVAAILSVIGLLCIIFLFKETLHKDNIKAFKPINPFSSIFYFLKYKSLFFLFVTYILFMLAFQFPLTLWSFFYKYRFEWSDSQIAVSFLS